MGHVSIRGFLANPRMIPPLMLQFQWNPTPSETKSAKYNDIEFAGVMAPVSVYSSGGLLRYKFTLIFDSREDARYLNSFSVEPLGMGVHPQVQTLMSFLYPEEKSVFDISDIGFGEPPACYFGLGPRVLRGRIRSVNPTYELYDKNMVPMRASVSVDFVADETGTWGKVNTIFRRMASGINIGGRV